MPDDVEFDTSELRNLSVDLGKGTAAMVVQARAIIAKGALNIKNGMIADARGIKHAPAFPSSITYDLDGLSAEIGPDKDRRQGALGNILYFGTSTSGPRIADIMAPLNKEAMVVEQFLGDLGASSIL